MSNYCIQDGRICEVIPNGKNKDPRIIEIANFTATIVNEFIVTDGESEHCEIELKANLGGNIVSITLATAEFEAMSWPLEKLGPRAIISAGRDMRDKVREAIQRLSPHFPKVQVRNHLGWFEFDGSQYFAHAGGIIGPRSDRDSTSHAELRGEDVMMPDRSESGASEGPTGPLNDIEWPTPKTLDPNELEQTGPLGPLLTQRSAHLPRVRPPDGCHDFRLPEPKPLGDELTDICSRTISSMLALGPDELSVPLLAAVAAAPLGLTDITLFLDGPTGTNKSTRSALAQQFFGAGMTSQNLPGSFLSTSNALLAQTHNAKDVVFTIDDFRPTSHGGDSTANRDADRLLRAQANRAGRARGTATGGVRVGKRPRGVMICSGEQMPEGESLSRRVVRLDCSGTVLTDNEHMRALLSNVQELASHEFHAQVMANFIQWIATNHSSIGNWLTDLRSEFKNALLERNPHSRLLMTVSDLAAAFSVLLNFLFDVGAIDEEEFRSLTDRCLRAMQNLIFNHGIDVRDSSPGERLVQLSAEALAAGHAHLTNRDGGVPRTDPGSWGYRQQRVTIAGDRLGDQEPTDDQDDPQLDLNIKLATADVTPLQTPAVPDQSRNGSRHDDFSNYWSPRGTCIGFIEDGIVRLLPSQALAVARALGAKSGRPLALAPQGLGVELHRSGYLIETTPNSKRLTVREPYRNQRIRFYRLSAESLLTPSQSIDDTLRRRQEEEFAELLA